MVSLNTDSSHPVYRALDYKEAEQLLSVITRVLSDRKPKIKWKKTLLPAAALLVSCFAVWRFAPATPSAGMPPFGQEEPRNASEETAAARFQGLPELRNPAPGNPYFGNHTTPNADNGQPMPTASPVRPSATRPVSVASQETLSPHIMQNLQKAAGRGYFTVPLSSGHERTLYVFADPECPNCKNWEPVVEALGNEYNVVVFPSLRLVKRNLSGKSSLSCIWRRRTALRPGRNCFRLTRACSPLAKRKPVTIKKKPRYNPIINAGKSPARRWPLTMSRSGNTVSPARPGSLPTTAAMYRSQR
ncbi:hypothetical protein GSH13_30635 (plasmid) [Klebsiella pneumoniae]|nr:hypothetical protein GSH13_30635 [Klebsiella pneumoniae]